MNALIRFAFGTAIVFTALPLHADDQKDIIGVWKGEMSGDHRGSLELTITLMRITGRNPKTGKSLGEGSYDLDASKKTLDGTGVAIPVRGITYLGLYSLEGDTLKWVANNGGRKRPVDLAHRPEKDQFLMILERQR